MQKYRALLMGGVCLGLVSFQVYTTEKPANARDLRPAPDADAVSQRAFEVASNPEEDGEKKEGAAAPAAAPADAPAAETAKPAAGPEDVPAAEAAAAPAASKGAAPPMTPSGVTWYSGDTTPAEAPAWAGEATMNPDYAAAAPAEAPAAAEVAPAAETPAPVAAAEEPAPPMTPPGVTWYSGDATPAEAQAWAAEATMNPDYSAPAAAEAPAVEAPAAAAAEEPAPPMTPPGVTTYNGDTMPSGTPAWAAEATVFPNAPAAAPAAQAAVEACRDALNAEAKAGKINFATSAWDVLPDSFKTLDKIAKVAKDCASSFVIEVGGHTDNTGKPASNKTISELRAQSVVRYLMRAGVDAAKLKAVGYGQDSPIGDNTTVAGRRENRRIAFLVTGG